MLKTPDTILVTDQAEALLNIDDVILQLRQQVMVLFDVDRPNWRSALSLGPQAFVNYVNINVVQCFYG